jgi:UDP-N-acetylmuramoyl-tripeptide--D-alanyl-D-alanine ligase
MKNMTLPEIANAIGGKMYLHGAEINISEGQKVKQTDEYLNIEAEGVVIDSRLCKKNGIFVAIKGEKNDGHDYIETVLDNGALGVICEKLPDSYAKRENGAYILVDDVLKALRELAAY